MSALIAALLLLAAVLGLAFRIVPRRAPGPAPARQLLLAAVVLLAVGAFGGWAVPRYGPGATGAWEVGDLRANGLRLVPSPPDDASRVLADSSLGYEGHRELYAIAREIPGILNRLYCWCGCVKQGRHRSALACYEDTSATGCGVCQETARIARAEVQRGITDPARIQQAIDREWAPPGARRAGEREAPTGGRGPSGNEELTGGSG